MGKNNEKFLFEKIFRENQNKIAIETVDQKISFDDLKLKVFSLIEYFKSNGLKKKQVVAVLLPNSVEFIYCYLACMIGGFIICPINKDSNKLEIKKVLSSVNAKLVINKKEQLKFYKTKKNYFKEFNPKRIMGIFLSSGTTGTPKGICHDSQNIISNAISFNKNNKIFSESRIYHLFPMSYMAGFLNSIISPLVSGGTIIFHSNFSINFAINFRKFINRYNINYLWLNPTMIKSINKFESSKKKLSKKLKLFVATSALQLEDKIEFKKNYKVNCLESYGMTEILIFSSERYNIKKKIYSNVGKLINGCKVLNSKRTQELFVKSNFINTHYFDLTKKRFTKNNYIDKFDTGDLGYLSKKKELFLAGRSKNLIIKGGLNISPEKLEKRLINFKNISESIFIGIKDKFYGENICLILKTKKGKKLNIKNLENYLNKYYSKHETPKKIIQIDKFITNKNDKIERKNILNKINTNGNIKKLYEKNY